MNIAIVTGASSGMGRETARQIDRIYTDGLDEIWLVARRTERLKQVADTLRHKSRIFSLDLTDKKDLADLELSLNLTKPNIKMLVNASGFGILGDFKNSEITEQSQMVRLNCEALTVVTRMCLAYMNKGARIIQFASSAAFLPQPGFAVYAASKAYVLSFSRALNAELLNSGISVTAVCPGPVDTEFFKVAKKSGFNFDFKKYFMAEEKDVVRQALIDAYHRRPFSVYSFFMKALMLVSKLIPHELILFILKFLK